MQTDRPIVVTRHAVVRANERGLARGVTLDPASIAENVRAWHRSRPRRESQAAVVQALEDAKPRAPRRAAVRLGRDRDVRVGHREGARPRRRRDDPYPHHRSGGSVTGWVLVLDHVDHPRAGRIGLVVGTERVLDRADMLVVRFPDGVSSTFFPDELSKWWVA